MLVPKLEINITDIGVSPNANVPAIVLLPVPKKPEDQCPRRKLASGESHSNNARIEEWEPNLPRRSSSATVPNVSIGENEQAGLIGVTGDSIAQCGCTQRDIG